MSPIAVFLDVLPRLGLTEAETAFAKLKEMALKTGDEMGVSLSRGAEAGLDKLKAAAISTERTVSDANAKMASSADLLTAAQERAAASASAAAGAQQLYSDALERQNALGVLTLAQTRELDALRTKATATSIAATTATARATDAEAKAAAASRDHSDATLAAAAASQKFAGAKDEAGKSVLNTASILNGVGAGSFLAFGAAMAVSADKAANFQQSQTKLVASAGETSQGMKQVSDGILQMAGSVGYSAGELSNAMYTVEKAGFDASKGGLDVLKASAQGANAEQADLAEVTKGLTISMNDFHFPTQNAADVMSKLVVATGASTATFQEFTGALHSVEPAAAAAGIKYEDLLATISQGTKSGASADQVTENIRNAINALSGAQAPARAAMTQLGISADDVSQHLRERGLAGSFQYLADTIKEKMDPQKLIPTGVFKQNAQELDNMTASLAAMSPAAAQLATGLRNGTVTAKEFRKGLMGTTGDDTQRLRDFQKWSNDIDDFSKRYKNGQSTLETYNQALRDVTGTVAGQTIALQVTGENAGATNDLIKTLTNTTREHDGTVKGFNETQETLNAKMRDAKAGFGAAAIELGEVFIPVLTDAAAALKDTAEFLAAHKDAVKDAVYVVGLLGGAWAATKIAMAIGSTVSALATGMATIGGFVTGLAGKYDALAVSAEAAAAAERDAANPSNFAKGGAAGTAARGALGTASAALPFAAVAGGFALWGNDFYKSHDDGTSNTDAIGRARGGGRTAVGQPDPRGGTLPIAGADQYAKPGAQAERRGGSAGNDTTPTPGGPLPVATENPALAADPGIPGNGIADTGGGGAKKPKATKDDPIWVAPSNPSDFKSTDSSHGVTGSSIIAGGFDLSPKSIGTFFSALLIDLAVGNPIGKTLADKQKRGDSADNPLYVSQVDVDRAQTKLEKAIHDNGPDSESAKKAGRELDATRAAVGTTGGYYNPKTGAITPRDPSAVGSDAALLAGVPSGQYVKPGGTFDLSKGLADCSSAVGDLVKTLDGSPTGGADRLNTGNASTWLPQHGFVPGEGGPGDFRVGYNSGHMQATLPGGTPFNWGSDAAAARGGVGGTGADDRAFTSHYYRPVGGGGSIDLTDPALTNPALTPAAPAGDDGSILGGLMSQFTGGGGLGPTFRRSPASGAPGTDGASLFAPGGILGGAPAGKGGAPGPFPSPSPGGGAGGQIGPFPVPGGVAPGGVGHSAFAGLGRGYTPPAPNAAPGSHMQPNASKPGVGNSVSNAPRSWGSGKGATSSIASSIISAAGPMAAMAPGSAQAAQLIDRTIGYGAQVGGIAVEGLMQSLIPTGGGGGIGDPSHSVLGKIAGGVAGAHKSAPNTAGTTAPPGPKPDDKAKQQPGGDTNHIAAQQNGGINTQGGDVHITAPNPQAFASDKPQNQYQFATR